MSVPQDHPEGVRMPAGSINAFEERTGNELSPRGFAFGIVFVFVATAIFSLSFVFPYSWKGVNTRWGLIIGSAAAITWPFFITLLSLVGRISFLKSLQICVRTMIWGNVVLLLAAVVNIAGYFSGWEPALSLHIAIVAVANLVMFGRFCVLSRAHLSLSQGLVLWFAALNGLFAGLVIIAYRLFIQ